MSDDRFDPFEDDMRRTKGRYYPPEPRDECRCTPDTYWEPGSICGYCEAKLEAEPTPPEIDEHDLAAQRFEWLQLDHGNG